LFSCPLLHEFFCISSFLFLFFIGPPTTALSPLPLHDALPISIQGSNVPNPDEAVPSFVSGAMAKAGKGLLEGTLQAGTSAVSDKLLDLVGQIKQLIRNGRSASLQRTFKKYI